MAWPRQPTEHVERIGSTTFATALPGYLIATAGLILLIEDFLWK